MNTIIIAIIIAVTTTIAIDVITNTAINIIAMRITATSAGYIHDEQQNIIILYNTIQNNTQMTPEKKHMSALWTIPATRESTYINFQKHDPNMTPQNKPKNNTIIL